MDPNEQKKQPKEETTDQQRNETTVDSVEYLSQFLATFLQLMDDLNAKFSNGKKIPSPSFIQPMTNNFNKIQEIIASDPNVVVILYYFSEDVREKLMERITEMRKACKEKKKSLQDVRDKLAILSQKIQQNLEEVTNLIESLEEEIELTATIKEESESESNIIKIEPDDSDN